MATVTINSNDSNTIDVPGATSWANAVAGITGGTIGFLVFPVVAYRVNGTNFELDRSFLFFDLSTTNIPAGAVINSVTFRIPAVANLLTDWGGTVYLTSHTNSIGFAANSANFNKIGSETNWGSKAMTTFSTTLNNDIALTATAIAALNIGGTTKIALRHGNDISGVAGGTTNAQGDQFSNSISGWQLIVDYTVGSLSPSSSVSKSASRSQSPSASISPSGSISPSPSASSSTSPSSSISRSVSPSVSPSLSPSASLSPSMSASLSPSGSASQSISMSASPSISTSPSASASSSFEASVFSRQASALLPSGREDLAIIYTDQEEIDVSTQNGVFVDIDTSSSFYLLHQYKINNENNHNYIIVRIHAKSTLAATSSPIYLQLYNFATASWNTLTINNYSKSNEEFDLIARIYEDQANYYNIFSSDQVVARIYQSNSITP